MGNDESKLHGTPLEPAWGQDNADPLSAFDNSNSNNNTPRPTTGGANINDIPDREELKERFEHALKNLDDQSEAIPQKSTDDEKWSFIQIQESKNVDSNPATFYIAYLKSILTNHASSKKKFKAKSARSTDILKDLEIALRTNSTPWLKEFLHHPETPGLDLLNEYLGFCLYAVVFGSFTDLFVTKNTKEKLSKKNSNVGGDINNYNDPYNATGNLQSNKNHGKTDDENSDQDELDHSTKIDLAVNNFETIKRSHSLPAKRILKNSKILADKEDIHLAIMCFRAICNYKYGFETVMQHKNVVNQLTLALTHHSLKTQARVLDLLGAVAYIKGGHEMCLRGYDYLKQTVGEKRRFTTLTKLIKKGVETNLEQYTDFVVAALKFVNVLVHTVGDMNYRVHLQYEFSCLNYDHILQKLVDKGNDQIKTQVKAYYDNMFDVSVLIGDSEARIAAEDRSNTLENRLYDEQEQRLQQEYNSMATIVVLEKQLILGQGELDKMKGGRGGGGGGGGAGGGIGGTGGGGGTGGDGSGGTGGGGAGGMGGGGDGSGAGGFGIGPGGSGPGLGPGMGPGGPGAPGYGPGGGQQQSGGGMGGGGWPGAGGGGGWPGTVNC